MRTAGEESAALRRHVCTQHELIRMTSTEGARFAFKFPPNGPNLTHLFVDRVLSQENALLMPSCGVLLGLILGHGDLFENTAGVGPTKGGELGKEILLRKTDMTLGVCQLSGGKEDEVKANRSKPWLVRSRTRMRGPFAYF